MNILVDLCGYAETLMMVKDENERRCQHRTMHTVRVGKYNPDYEQPVEPAPIKK